MKLLFATHNQHKVDEVRAILGDRIELISLSDIGDHEEIDETGTTLEENALIKVREVYRRHGINCFADDTGLEVRALNGAPGVYSARYAGAGHDSQANVDKLLTNLTGITDRQAHFRTVIALIIDGEEYLFEGQVDGAITTHQDGSQGFGYDPVFLPDGYTKTFGLMTADEKNHISHRYQASMALAEFIKDKL